MNDYENKVAQASARFWKSLQDALPVALNGHGFPIGYQWDTKPEDIKASHSELRDAMIEGLRGAGRWAESMSKDASKDEEELNGADPNWRGAKRLVRRLVSQHAQSAFVTLTKLGVSGAALEAFEAVQDEFKGTWDCLEICATLLSSSLEGPARNFKDPMGTAERVKRALESKWWDSKDDIWETMRDGRDPLAHALALAARAASFNSDLADASGMAVKKSLPLWVEEGQNGVPADVDLVKSFGKEIARHLGHEKIRGGKLPEPFWNALPWHAQLGFSQELGSKSKMGNWSRTRLLSELAAGTGDNASYRMEITTATFWLSFDKGGIEILEKAFPHASTQWLRSGVENIMGQGGAVTWHDVESSWEQENAAAWARKMTAKAGLAAPKRGQDKMAVASSWAHLCEALRALREQESLALELKVVEKNKKAKATVVQMNEHPEQAVGIKMPKVGVKKRL